MIKHTVFTELTGKHTLIAGSTGSGKSVVENGIIYNLLFDTPNVQFIFIDLKRVELAEYKRLPQCVQYADTLETAISALQVTLKEIDKRYKWMQKRSVRTFNGSPVYLVIDELADLMTVDRKNITPLLRRILQIGRASNVHVIACTQTALSTVIDSSIKVNFTTRIGLRTNTKNESRVILDRSGLEMLPKYGQAIVMNDNGDIVRYKIPMYTDDERQQLIKYRSRKKFPWV